jgi:hypothetical protein
MNFENIDNKLLEEAEDYIREHRLIELFEVNKIFNYIFLYK